MVTGLLVVAAVVVCAGTWLALRTLNAHADTADMARATFGRLGLVEERRSLEDHDFAAHNREGKRPVRVVFRYEPDTDAQYLEAYVDLEGGVGYEVVLVRTRGRLPTSEDSVTLRDPRFDRTFWVRGDRHDVAVLLTKGARQMLLGLVRSSERHGQWEDIVLEGTVLKARMEFGNRGLGPAELSGLIEDLVRTGEELFVELPQVQERLFGQIEKVQSNTYREMCARALLERHPDTEYAAHVLALCEKNPVAELALVHYDARREHYTREEAITLLLSVSTAHDSEDRRAWAVERLALEYGDETWPRGMPSFVRVAMLGHLMQEWAPEKMQARLREVFEEISSSEVLDVLRELARREWAPGAVLAREVIFDGDPPHSLQIGALESLAALDAEGLEEDVIRALGLPHLSVVRAAVRVLRPIATQRAYSPLATLLEDARFTSELLQREVERVLLEIKERVGQGSGGALTLAVGDTMSGAMTVTHQAGALTPLDPESS